MSAPDGSKNDILPKDLLKRISERNIRHPFPFYYLLHSDHFPCEEIFDEKIKFQSEDFLLKIPALQFLINSQIPKLNQDKSREEWLKIFPQDKINPHFLNPNSSIGLLSYDEIYSLHCLLYSHNYQICFIFKRSNKIYCQSLGCLSTNNVIFINCFHKEIEPKGQNDFNKDFRIDLCSVKYKLISRFPASKGILNFPEFEERKFHVLNYLYYMSGQKIDQQYKNDPKLGFVYLQDRAYFKHFFKSHSIFANNSSNILEKFGGAFKNFGLQNGTEETFQHFAKPFEQELDLSSYEKTMKYTKYDINDVISDKILAKSEIICVYKVKYPGDGQTKDITIIKDDIVKDGYLPLSMKPDYVSADNMYSLYKISQGGDISYIVGPAFPDNELTNTFYSTEEINEKKIINEDIIKKFDKYQPEIHSGKIDYNSEDNEEQDNYSEGHYCSDQSDNDNSEEKQYYSDQSDNDNSEGKQYYSDQSDNDNSEGKQYYSDQSDNANSEGKQYYSDQSDNDQSGEKQGKKKQSNNDHSEEKQEKSKQPDINITFAVRHSCIAKFKYTHTFYNTTDKSDQLIYPSNVLLQIENYCKFAHNAIKCHSNPEQKVRLFGYCTRESKFLEFIDEKYKTSFSKVTSLGIFSEFKDDILNICVIEPNIEIKYLQESVKSVKHIDSTVILSHNQLQNAEQEKEEFNNFETIAKILAIYVTLVQFRDIDFKTIIDITGLRNIKDKSHATKGDKSSQKHDDNSSEHRGKSSKRDDKSSKRDDESSTRDDKSSGHKSHKHKSRSSKRK